MKRLVVLVMIFGLCASGASVSFAGGKKWVRGLKNAARRKGGRSLAPLSKGAGEAVNKALLKEMAQNAAAHSAAGNLLAGGAGRIFSRGLLETADGRREIFRQMAPSLAQVVHPVTEKVLSSGFVFEEYRSGAKRLWAAVPYHVAGGPGNKIVLRLFRPDGTSVRYKVEVAVSGGYGFTSADVSLCLLPSWASAHVIPLKLSPEGVKPGQRLNGYGFTVEETAYSERTVFNVLPELPVRGVGEYNVVADVNFERNLSGACGSPYLDGQGRVAAVHSGSVFGRAVNAVNVTNGLSSVLDAYYGSAKPRDLVFKNKKITTVSVGESIGIITVERGGAQIFRQDMQRYAGDFLYGRMERTLPAARGDEVTIQIWRHRNLVRIVKFQAP